MLVLRIIIAALLLNSGLALPSLHQVGLEIMARKYGNLGSRLSSSCTPPVMPVGVAETDCPHTYNLDSNGNCISGLPSASSVNSDGSNCLGYCEQSITFGYGTEVPFENAYCEAGSACTLATGNSTSNTNAFSFNVGYNLQVKEGDAQETFTLGASYQWSQTVTYTTTVTNEKPDNGDKRGGYFTFVPWTITSCGTLTQTGLSKATNCPRGQCLGPDSCDASTAKSVSNWCNTSQVSINGVKQGYVIFVYQPDVGDRVPYLDGQNSLYYTPGVSNNPTFAAKASTLGMLGLLGKIADPTR